MNSRGDCGLPTALQQPVVDWLAEPAAGEPPTLSGGPFSCCSTCGSVGLLPCLSRPAGTHSGCCDSTAGIKISCPGPGASPTHPRVLSPAADAGFAQEGCSGCAQVLPECFPCSQLRKRMIPGGCLSLGRAICIS